MLLKRMVFYERVSLNTCLPFKHVWFYCGIQKLIKIRCNTIELHCILKYEHLLHEM